MVSALRTNDSELIIAFRGVREFEQFHLLKLMLPQNAAGIFFSGVNRLPNGSLRGPGGHELRQGFFRKRFFTV